MATCGIICSGQDAPVNYLAALSTLKKKKSGHAKFFLIEKGTTFTDITDTAEWDAYVLSGEVVCSPCGVIDFGTPTFNTSPDACGNDEVDETVFTPTFSTKYLDPDGLTHCKYWIEFAGVENCFNIGFFDCYGNPIFSPDWAAFLNGVTLVQPTTDVGLEFTLAQVPHFTTGDNNKEQWNVQFDITLDGQQILAHSLVAGLEDSVCA